MCLTRAIITKQVIRQKEDRVRNKHTNEAIKSLRVILDSGTDGDLIFTRARGQPIIQVVCYLESTSWTLSTEIFITSNEEKYKSHSHNTVIRK